MIDEMIPPVRFRQLAEAILEAGLDIRYYALAKPVAEFTLDLFRLMYQSGCRYLLWGVESGSPRVLELMQKGTSLTDMGKVLENAHEAGIRNHCYVIIGFPTETREEAVSTVQFLDRNKNVISQVHRGTFTLEEDSPVFDQPEKFGITRMWKRSESFVPHSLGYDTSSGMRPDEAKELFSRILPFLREFNPYSRYLGNFRDHALLLYSKRGSTLDMSARRIPAIL